MLGSTAGAQDEGATFRADEGDDYLEFVVHRSGGDGTQEASFSYGIDIDAGTATNGVDYTAVSGSETFAVGDDDPKPIPVPILDDTIDEDSETIVFRIEHTTNLELLRHTGTGYILDDDDPPVVSVAGDEGMENVGSLVFEVTLSGPSGRVVSTGYASNDITATDSQDYTGVSGTLTFAPGATTKTVPVKILDDQAVESTETFGLSLVDTHLATPHPDDHVGIGTIEDDDVDLSTLSITGASGEEGEDHLTFVASLSPAPQREVSIQFATADGTATAQTDYEAVDGEFVLGPDQAQHSIPVRLVDDDEFELEESFEVLLTTEHAIWARATGRIVDDEPYLTISRTTASVSENTRTVGFDFELHRGSGEQPSVSFVTRDGSAVAGEDYQAANSSIMFESGNTASVSLVIVNDDLYEGNETFSVVFDGSVPILLGEMGRDTVTADVTIKDDQRRPLFTLDDAPDTSEDGTLRFPVRLTGKDSSTRRIWMYPSNPGRFEAKEGEDYVGDAGYVTIPAGEQMGTFEVRLVDDDLDEPNERVVALFGANDGAQRTAGVGVIVDNDPPSEVSIRVTDGIAAEAWEDDGPIRFHVELNRESGFSVSVDFATSDGTATAGDDYETRRTTVNFAPGETEKAIDVKIVDGSTPEQEETLTVTISDPRNATLGVAQGEGVIRDNDGAGLAGSQLSITDARAEEGDALTFAVALAPAPATELRVSYASADGTALAGSDYKAVSGEITFGPSGTTHDIVVESVEDQVSEHGESFHLTLSTTQDGMLVRATGRIIDDDLYMTISRTSAEVGETAGVVRFDFELSYPSENPQSVSFTTHDGSAMAGSDYGAANTSIAFRTGETRVSATVTILDDDLYEEDETFSLVFDGSVPILHDGVERDTVTADVTIEDGQRRPLFTLHNAPDTSEDGTLRFPVRLTGKDSSTRRIWMYTSNPGELEAKVGNDYVEAAGYVTIPAGEQMRTFDVRLVDDDLDEPNERVKVLFGVNDGVTQKTRAVGWILDNDPKPTVSVHARSAQSEDSGTVEAAEVRLSNPSSWRFEVQFSFEDGAATSGDDFEGVERRNLTIPGGRTIIPIPATYVDDGINEETEAYSVRLHSTTDRASLGSPSAAEVQILDDDPLGEPRVPPTSATEGEDLAFEVRLERTASRAIEVDYAVSGGTAREGLDFETVEPGTLTFLPETEFLVVRVPTRDDEMDEATESVVIELTDEHGVTVSAEGMIVDDDEEPALTLTSSRAEESAGSVDFEVTMSGNETERTVAVLYETVEGTAEESVDYHATAGVVTFAPGSRHTVLPVPVVADNHNEPDEEIFRLVLSEPEHASVTESEAIGTILDSDGNPEFSVAATVGPEGSELGFEINLSPSSESHQFVDYSTRDGTATRDLDYLAASGRLEFLPRTRVQTVFVETLADAISEPDEDLLLVLEIPDALSVGTPDRATLAVDGAEARGRIEGSAAGLSVTGGSALESDGELVFQVTLNSAAVDTVTVDYATEDGTAQSGADYARTAGSLTFAAGDTVQTVGVDLVDNDEIEPQETFQLVLSAPTNATVAVGSAQGTILDDDQPELSVAGGTAEEGAAVSFRVTLSRAAPGAVTVSYATSDGTARAGADYARSVGVLSFPPGETVRTVAVALIDDAEVEPEEEFRLALSSPSNATVSVASAIGRIVDNDQLPSLRVAGGTASEGGTVGFRVQLSSPASRLVTVVYRTSERTALAGADYVEADGTLTFTPGETVRTVTVDTINDSETEPLETFVLSLSSPTNATIAEDSAVGRIVDDDAPPALRVSDGSATEGGTVAFRVSLSRYATGAVTVRYATADGTALAGADYVEADGTLTFTPGETVRTVTVDTINDSETEPLETLVLSLSSPTNATIAEDSALGRIVDDDAPPTLRVSGGSATEGGTVAFRVSLSRYATGAVTVRYATADGTALAGADYVEADGTLTFTPGETVRIVTVDTINDSETEPLETFVLSLSSPTNATIAEDSALGRIVDDDAPPTLRVSGGSATEGGTVAFRVSLSRSATGAVTVRYATADGTALAGADYVEADGTLTFTPGETVRIVTVDTINDSETEPLETFVLSLSSPTNATIAEDSALGRIVDDDAPPALRVSGGSATEGGAVGFRVSLSRSATGAVTVRYATADGTALAGADYVEADGTLTFTPGETVRIVTVDTINDSETEPLETFVLSLSSPTNATIAEDSALGRIVDDDAPPALRVSGGSATEGGAVGFRVSLSRSATGAVTVRYATADGTALAGADYVEADGTLTFTPGETVRTVTVDTINDSETEPLETFVLSLSSPTNATIAEDSALGRIVDDDIPPALRVSGGSATEGGAVAFRVSLSRSATVAVTVRYATADGTARAGTDYEETAGTLTFAAGETAQTVTVGLLDDADVEPQETFLLSLSSPTNATVAVDTAEGRILDNDTLPMLSVVGGTTTEGGAVTFEVTLSGTAGASVAVGYRTSDETARAGADYAETTGTLVFAVGETTRTVAVDTVDDADMEPEETFRLTLSAPENATVTTGSAEGRIIDDDEPPKLRVSDATGAEDIGELAFAVSLDSQSDSEVTVAYATLDGTARSASDYAASSGTLTIPAGEVAATIRVAVTDDSLDEADETFAITLTMPQRALLAHPNGTGTILDNDDPPTLSVADAAGEESAGALAFLAVLDVPSGVEVTASFATADGSAKAGADYGAASGMLTFPPGSVESTIRVAVLDDQIHEPDETFTLTLTNAREATVADGDATGSIRDDDLTPPRVATRPPGPMLCVGGDPYRVGLAVLFTGERLHYSATSSDESVAVVEVVGGIMTVVPVSEGSTTVTATARNDTDEATLALAVTVVADPAELAAVESGFGAVGRGWLDEWTANIHRRVAATFAEEGFRSERTTFIGGTPAPPDRSRANPRPLALRTISDAPFEYSTRRRTAGPGTNSRATPLPFSISLAEGDTGTRSASLWGRGATRRFGGGAVDLDGSLSAYQVGADARSGDWLAGVSLSFAKADADYRFIRSADVCGGNFGEGELETELTSVHPYVGRRVGDGWIWATLGAGRGEATVLRCESGRRSVASLSMRTMAVGGRHPFAARNIHEWSLVEDIGVIRLATGSGPAPAGNRSATAGRARLGVELRVEPQSRAALLTTWTRASAQGDWGDGDSGAGLEIAAGVRLLGPNRRIGLEVGGHALAHSAGRRSEHGMDLAASVLPRSDGTGLRLSMSSRRGQGFSATDPWQVFGHRPNALAATAPVWRTKTDLGYGLPTRRGLVVPFVRLEHEDRRQDYRTGLRYELPFGRKLRVEWAIGRQQRGENWYYFSMLVRGSF